MANYNPIQYKLPYTTTGYESRFTKVGRLLFGILVRICCKFGTAFGLFELLELLKSQYIPCQPVPCGRHGNPVFGVYTCAAFSIRKKGRPNSQPVFKWRFSCICTEDWRAFADFFTGAGAVVVFLYSAANVTKPTIRPKGCSAFLPFAGCVLDAGVAGANFGCHLFIPVAPVDTAFL